MNGRDHEYIENRLLAPAVDLGEAIERLRKVGKAAEAGRLLAALTDLTDVCRDVRRRLFSQSLDDAALGAENRHDPLGRHGPDMEPESAFEQEEPEGLPPAVQRAMDMLADWGSARAREAHPEYEHHDALRLWIAGAVEAQVTDPDYDQASDAEFLRIAEEAS